MHLLETKKLEPAELEPVPGPDDFSILAQHLSTLLSAVERGIENRMDVTRP